MTAKTDADLGYCQLNWREEIEYKSCPAALVLLMYSRPRFPVEIMSYCFVGWREIVGLKSAA
jgi:hypothetical protein